MVHVPYRGGAPATTDLLGGQVQVIFSPLPESIEHIRAGKLRCQIFRPWGTSCRVTKRAAGKESEPQETHPLKSSTSFMSTPAIILNSSPTTCCGVPLPADAMLILPGLALA